MGALADYINSHHIGSGAPSPAGSYRSSFTSSFADIPSDINASNYRPHSSSLLQNALAQLAQQGTPGQFAKAKDVAKHGSPGWAGKLLQGALWTVGLPQRAVLTAAQETGDLMRGKWGEHDYAKQVMSSNWGARSIVDEAMPHAPSWVKFGAGLTGDLISDPLMYVWPGTSQEFRAIGGTEGLGKLAANAARKAEVAGDTTLAEEIKGLSAKAAKSALESRGGASHAELDRLAELVGLDAKTLRYGVQFHLPFTDIYAHIPGTEPIGRALMGAGGELGNAARTSRFGQKLINSRFAGYATAAKDALHRGEAELHYRASSFLEGIDRSEAAARQWNVEMNSRINKVVRMAHREGMSMEELDTIVRNRALPDAIHEELGTPLEQRLGGQVWQDAMADPGKRKVAEAGAKLAEDMKVRANSIGRVGGSDVPVIASDPAQRLRPWLWRTESDQFRETVGKSFKPSMPGLAPTAEEGTKAGKFLDHFVNSDYGKNLVDGKLHFPGQVMSNGEMAGAIEDQVQAAVDAVHGPEAFPWYERNFAKGGRAYVHRMTGEVRNTKMLNFMADRGIAEVLDRKVTNEPWVMSATQAPMAGGTWFQNWANRLTKAGTRDPITDLGWMDHLIIDQPAAGKTGNAWVDKMIGKRGIEGTKSVLAGEADMYENAAKVLRGEPDALQALQDGKFSMPPDSRKLPGSKAALRRAAVYDQMAADRRAAVGAAHAASQPLLRPGEGVSELRQFLDEAGKTAKVSYSGKVINKTQYTKLKSFLAESNRMVSAINRQFTAQGGDAYRAYSWAQDLRGHVDDLIAAGMKPDHPRVLELLERADDHQKAYELYKLRATLTDEMAARVAHLGANAHEVMGELGRHGAVRELTNEQLGEGLSTALRQMWEGHGVARALPADVAGYAAELEHAYEVLKPSGATQFINDWYDPVNHWMKSYLTMAPGFSARNLVGGMFNNMLAGVKLGNMKEWLRIYGAGLEDRTLFKRLTIPGLTDPVDKLRYELAQRAGIVGAGQYAGELGALGQRSLNPFAGIHGGDKTFLLPYYNRRLNEQVIEPVLRGSLFTDRINKALEQDRFKAIFDELGIKDASKMTDAHIQQVADAIEASPQFGQALADVNKYHFNYNDLSKFERQVVRRIIPFYTWTRHNVPLQIEAMFTQPGKSLGVYYHLKNNIEAGTPGEPIVPGYFGEQGFIRLPFSAGGSRVYGGISNLPFFDPFRAADVQGQLVGMVSPLLKAPLEISHGAQFQTGVPITGKMTPMPEWWARIPGLVPALQQAGKMPFHFVHEPLKGKDGKWYMRDSDQYLFGQYLPFMYQVQRLFPSQPRFQKRLVTTWVSFLAGVNVRTNTPNEIENEMFRRNDIVRAMGTQLKQLGYAPPDKRLKPGHIIGGHPAGAKARTPLGPALSTIVSQQYSGVARGA